MRAIFAGIAAATVYFAVIAHVLAMAMPTRAQVEAYIEAAYAPTMTSVAPAVAKPLAG